MFLTEEQADALPEECGEVYSLNMATPDQFEKRLSDFEKKQTKHGEKIANLEGRIAVPKPEGWLKKNSHWTTPAIAILSAIFGTGFVISYFSYKVDERIGAKLDAPLKQLGKLEVDVGKLTGKLDTLMEIEKARLKQLGELRPADLRNRLPELAQTLTMAKALGVPAPPGAESLRRNLSSIDDRGSAFWPAAVALVNYESPVRPRRLPPCPLKDQPPAKLAEAIDAVQTDIKFALIPFENCEVVLDSPEAQARFLDVMGLFDIEFRNCNVIYRGGPLLFPAHPVSGRTKLSLIFKDCTFEISAPGVPPKDGREMLSTLLAAESKKAVTLTISTV